MGGSPGAKADAFWPARCRRQPPGDRPVRRRGKRRRDDGRRCWEARLQRGQPPWRQGFAACWQFAAGGCGWEVHCLRGDPSRLSFMKQRWEARSGPKGRRSAGGTAGNCARGQGPSCRPRTRGEVASWPEHAGRGSPPVSGTREALGWRGPRSRGGRNRAIVRQDLRWRIAHPQCTRGVESGG